MLSNDLIDFLTFFEPGTHAVFFYDNQEAKRELLFSHLKYGQNKQGLAYVCSEETPEQIRRKMIEFGLDANTVRGNQRLTIANYDEVYIVGGQVKIPEIIGKFSNMVDSCKANGFSGLRAAAEMSCFFKHNLVEEMVAYEKALHTRFFFSAVGICAFNVIEMLRSGHMDIFMSLIKAHDPIIYSTPKGFLLLKPPKARADDVERVMQVRVRR
ncbi:MAG: MEDS domain-containing protein [Thaumarchaeota archaeon]|nr:MEDS domain-containing protein [Nitrososphaerota archaeon]